MNNEIEKKIHLWGDRSHNALELVRGSITGLALGALFSKEEQQPRKILLYVSFGIIVGGMMYSMYAKHKAFSYFKKTDYYRK